jgi:hypothetical protein
LLFGGSGLGPSWLKEAVFKKIYMTFGKLQNTALSEEVCVLVKYREKISIKSLERAK